MIIGIDEVGRGPIAGPLVVGAVALPIYNDNIPYWYQSLKDSKQLKAKERLALSKEIKKNQIFYGLGWVSASEMNRLTQPIITNSLRLACLRALNNLSLNPEDEIIIDGNINFLKNTKYEAQTTTLIKADDKIKAVSAASIIAKVARDQYMEQVIDRLYPQYLFKNHVGYGTKKHLESIHQYGACPEHRLFCRNFTDIKPTASIPEHIKNGQLAEQKVADLLEKRGHRILYRNFRTKLYEIDIISESDQKIFFTEVKYRKTKNFGTPLEAIDAKKYHQMLLAAELFLTFHNTNKQPVLLVASVFGEKFMVEDILAIN